MEILWINILRAPGFEPKANLPGYNFPNFDLHLIMPPLMTRTLAVQVLFCRHKIVFNRVIVMNYTGPPKTKEIIFEIMSRCFFVLFQAEFSQLKIPELVFLLFICGTLRYFPGMQSLTPPTALVLAYKAITLRSAAAVYCSVNNQPPDHMVYQPRTLMLRQLLL